MDDSQVQEKLERTRLEQTVIREAEESLMPATALVCSLRGFASLRQDANPFRPVSYVTALHALFKTVDVSPAVRLDWLLLLTSGLGLCLCDVYDEMVERLEAAGVQPAPFVAGVSHNPSGPTGRTTGPRKTSSYGAARDRKRELDAQREGADSVAPEGDASGSGESGDPDDQPARLTVRQLKSLLAGEFGPAWGRRASDQAALGSTRIATVSTLKSDSDGDHTMPAALEALDDMQILNRSVDRLAQRVKPVVSHVAGAGFDRRRAQEGHGQQADSARASAGVSAAPTASNLGRLPAPSDRRQVEGIPPIGVDERRSTVPATPIVEPMNAAELATLDPAHLYKVLRMQARGMGQVLGLEVVIIMVDSMANDASLLPSVQTIMRSLESPLLRLIMVDPRFFSDKTHPARKLLEAISENCGRFSSETDSGFAAYVEPLRRAVNELLHVPIESPEPFQYCLNGLHGVWGEQLQAERAKREDAENLLRTAEQRNLMALSVANEIRVRPDATFVPPDVLSFAIGPWAQVVAQAWVKSSTQMGAEHGARPPEVQVWMDVVVDLFWSVNPDWARLDTGRLVRMIPGLLSRLRAGLKNIEFPQTQTDAFFNVLMGCHQKALLHRSQGPNSVPGALSAANAKASAVAALTKPGMLASAPMWLGPTEAQASGFMSDFDAAPSQFDANTSVQSRTRTGAQSGWDRHDVLEALPPGSNAGSLKLGTWLDIASDTHNLRARLVWASPEGSMYMFTSSKGRNQTLARDVLNRLIQQGRVQYVPHLNIVDAAIDAVAQTARQNGVDSRLSSVT
jgi:hypothetical protein